ncbi:MAG: ATP-binding protein [Candidatus Aminicenantes bacterium]|nr:ATP-binding protein [Candidatus Aminicenantes bacterium]
MDENQDQRQKKGTRIVVGIIVLLIILFFVIDVFLRGSAEFSPGKVTSILLAALQFIVLLLALILFFVLGRYLVKLYLERKRKVVGAHFKTKLVIFFTALSFIPTLLLFIFTSRVINNSIEQWFRLDITRLVKDTRAVADGFYATTSEETHHFAQQLAREIQRFELTDPALRPRLEEFVKSKLTEYRLDEISLFLGGEELFSLLNPNLPLQDYRDLNTDDIRKAPLGLDLNDITPMGTGEFVRRGVSFTDLKLGAVVVTAGKFLPQNLTQKMNSIMAMDDRYNMRGTQRDLTKTLYTLTLIFVTLIIVFTAIWIGFHIAKSITVPIEKLVYATKEVSRGNLAVKIEDPAADEIGTLIDSFNQMTADLRTGQEEVAQKTAEVGARQRTIEIVLNAISTGVIALDARGVVTTINPAAREMLDLPDKNPAGRMFRDLLGLDRFQALCAAIDVALKNRTKISDREIQMAMGVQTKTFSLTLTPLRKPEEDFSGLIVALDDLTQLITAQKIAAWKEVAQRVAHEIKNPLTPIQLNAERIIRNLKKADTAGGEVIEEGARVIIQEAQTIKALVDEFSDFARLPKINLQPASLDDILRQVANLFRGIFADIAFDIRIAPDVPSEVRVDADQVKRVFINLIDNAIDAMNKKGTITLLAAYDRDSRHVLVTVMDTGPGLPVEDLDKIFLPTFSTKKKGRGLGLAIVSQIVREHEGLIRVENNRPMGAKFIIELPV